MRRGLMRITALLLAVVFIAGISGAGALMEVTSYSGTAFSDSDSGPVSQPSESEPDSQPDPGPASSEPAGGESVSSSEPEQSQPPIKWTQETVDTAVAAMAAELQGYVGSEAANADKIWAAAARLAEMPRILAQRAPDYALVSSLLESLPYAMGARYSVLATPEAEALGILAAKTELAGALLASGMNGGPAVLSIDVKSQPTHRLPSDVTGRNMTVFNIGFTVNGTPVRPVLPITVTMPMPRGTDRREAVLLCYADVSGTPQYLRPWFTLEGSTEWRMSFAANSFGEFVLANTVEPKRSSSNRDTEESRVYSYWRDVISRIESCEAGGEVFSNAKSAGARNIPTTVLDALYGKDVTLYIEFGAVNEIVINGLKMLPVPMEKVFYPFWELADLYAPDGGPAGMRIQLVPEDGAEVRPETYVQTVEPTANIVQNVGGQTSRDTSEQAAATETEQVQSREDVQNASSAQSAAASEPVLAETKPKAAGVIPIWAPVAIAAGVLLGLGIGMLAARQGKGKRENDQGKEAPFNEK